MVVYVSIDFLKSLPLSDMVCSLTRFLHLITVHIVLQHTTFATLLVAQSNPQFNDKYIQAVTPGMHACASTVQSHCFLIQFNTAICRQSGVNYEIYRNHS